MIVYRIADYNGRGPYISEYLPDWVNSALQDMRWAHSDKRHPAPHQEIPYYYIQPYELCAFASQSDLLDWFDGYEELLDMLGFYVWEFEVHSAAVAVLSRQVVVMQSHMRPVTTYTLV